MLGQAGGAEGVAAGGRGAAGGMAGGEEGGWAPATEKGENRKEKEKDGGWILGGLWALGIAAAWVGTAIIYQARMGINWAIWVSVLAGGLAWSATRKRRRADRAALWAIGLAVLAGWGSAITDNQLFQGLIVAVCAALLATAARIAAGVAGNRIGVAQMLGAPAADLRVFDIRDRAALAGGRERPVRGTQSIDRAGRRDRRTDRAGVRPDARRRGPGADPLALGGSPLGEEHHVRTHGGGVRLPHGAGARDVRDGAQGFLGRQRDPGVRRAPVVADRPGGTVDHHRRRGDRVRVVSRPAADVPLSQRGRAPRERHELHGIRAPRVRRADRRGDTVRAPDPGAGPPHAA